MSILIFGMNIENNIIGQILNLTAIMVFFVINGHHYIIRGLAATFKVIPLGHYSINESVLSLLVKYSGTIFVVAVKIAAPVMVAFFLLHVATGVISRIIPQMQVFFVLQPVQIIIGLSMLAAGMPIFIIAIKYLLEQYENSLYDLIKVMAY